ncbi:hypothetical protein CA13_31220 [Planctomycetes bacterium CA13]|uniref:Lipoprotein n=2 Tax=Novipirellula herctigrandis TaxID=2527986 RepID=A0A5C5Z2R8_9BACT|nr:hypothetical protein CA13_31220 [Planctomycetes bacterium CA13]
MRIHLLLLACCTFAALFGCSNQQATQAPSAQVSDKSNPNAEPGAHDETPETANPDPVVDPRADDALDATTFVLQWRLRNANTDKTCFISTGRSDKGWIDPPEATLALLASAGHSLRPASAARLPKSGEMETENRFRGVEDPDTGERSYIYYAHVTNWIDENTAEISYGIYGGPLAGGGGSLVVEKKDGKWSIKEHKGNWVS